eukprot:1707537-Rhodomonas_salina.1
MFASMAGARNVNNLGERGTFRTARACSAKNNQGEEAGGCGCHSTRAASAGADHRSHLQPACETRRLLSHGRPLILCDLRSKRKTECWGGRWERVRVKGVGEWGRSVKLY